MSARPSRRTLSDFTSDERAEIGRSRQHQSADEVARAFDATVPIVKKIYQLWIFL